MNSIIGIWHIDSKDMNSIEMLGNVSIEFKVSGELIYIIHLEDRDQLIIMTYEIQGNILISDQPSNPQKEKTEFLITEAGKLELYFGGVKSVFIKGS
jgi:hypothetical protein